MTPPSVVDLERLLALRALSFQYPCTPDVSAKVRARILSSRHAQVTRLLRATALFGAIALTILAAVPQARALVAGWFRIGVIQIAPDVPTPAPSSPQVPLMATPIITPSEPAAAQDLPASIAGLTGITTLEEVESRRGGRIALPQYPANLGVPDVVVYQPEFDMLVLVWRDAADRSRVSLALFEFLSTNPIVKKVQPTILEETMVGSAPALWVEGPYPLGLTNGEYEWRRIVTGRSLLWERGGVTFRLESDLALDEARLIAESIPASTH